MRHFVLTTIFLFHPLPFRHWQINFVVMWHDDVLVLQIWSLRTFLVVCLTAQTAMASTSVGSQRILVYYESQVLSFFWKLEMSFRFESYIRPIRPIRPIRHSSSNSFSKHCVCRFLDRFRDLISIIFSEIWGMKLHNDTEHVSEVCEVLKSTLKWPRNEEKYLVLTSG